MIRTVLISTAALFAIAGAADAGTVKVSLSGKTEAMVKVEIAKASEAACSDVPAIDYAPCVQAAYQDAMAKVAKLKAQRIASLTF